MQNKKYYSISEVTKILKVHAHQLRYIEKILPNFIVQKIKGRRYYTKQDIAFLEKSMIKHVQPAPSKIMEDKTSKGILFNPSEYLFKKQQEYLTVKLADSKKYKTLSPEASLAITEKIDKLIYQLSTLSYKIKSAIIAPFS